MTYELMSIATIWGKVWPILIGILFFGLIIMIHELGHFVVAKLSGVKVNEFSIGMGPALIQIRGGETLYGLRLFPIGGYVAMEGEDEDSADKRSFSKQKVWKRISIVVAGATMNLILGFLLTTILVGQQNLVGTTTIASFDENAVSAQYGLQAGDTIVKINGTRAISSKDITFLMSRDEDGIYDLLVKRNNQLVELKDVKFASEQKEGITVIHYDFTLYGVKKNIGSVIKGGFLESVSTTRYIWLTLFDLITGRYGLSQLAGPVGAVGVIAEVASQNFSSALMLLAFLSINVGVMNLLPIPALDGGRLFFLIIEAIIRRPLLPKYEKYIHAIGLILLFAFMIFITFNDIFNLFRGGIG